MDEFVLRLKDPKLQEEYGSLGPVKFAKVTAKMYDSNGKEIKIPECEVCKKQLSSLIGKDSMAWYCFEHGFKKEREALKDPDCLRISDGESHQ